MKTFKLFLTFLILIGSVYSQGQLNITTFKAGAFQTNCYIVYDQDTKEAVLFDTCAPADSLIEKIKDTELNLKFVFLTHAHEDHISGIPEILKEYPNAEILIAEEEYESFTRYSNWRELFDKQMVDEWLASEPVTKLMDFDYSTITKYSFLEDGEVYKLGDHEITALKLPGHSPGSYCFSIDGYLFSGDLIIYNSVGYLDYELGSPEEITKSIQLLYSKFSDDTKIMPGHGPSSTIGFEKKNNGVVREGETFW